MWFWITVTLVGVALLVAKKKGQNLLKDKAAFDAYVAKNSLSIEEQKELCERFNLDHQIGHRSYDSVEDWQKELTVVWAGQSEDIEFTYRKYDERERRKITPTEFGFDGNKKLYIKGICSNSNESRTFKTSRIETKLKVENQRFSKKEWLEQCLGVSTTELKEQFDVEV